MMEDLGGSSKRSKSSSRGNTACVVVLHMFTYDTKKLLDKEKSVHSRALWRRMRHVLKDATSSL